MKIGKFYLYLNNELYKTFEGKDVKSFFVNWDGTFAEGKVIETIEGKMKVITAALLNVTQPEKGIDTEVFLEKI